MTHIEASVAVKNPRINQRPISALRRRTPVLPQLPQKLRGLVEAAYAAYGGAENMTLNDWRDLDLEFNRRLENEYQQR